MLPTTVADDAPPVPVTGLDGKHLRVADDSERLDLTDPRKSVNLLDEDERNTVPVTDSLSRRRYVHSADRAGGGSE